jgi:uncharacterized protein YgfB (UPF0149 family)
MPYTRTDMVMGWVNYFLTGIFVGIVAFGIDVLTN